MPGAITDVAAIRVGHCTAELVSEMLGHSSVGTTLDPFSQVAPTMHRQVATTFDALLAGL